MLPASVAAIGSISLLGWLLASLGAIATGLAIAYLAGQAPRQTFLDGIGHFLGPVWGLASTLLYYVSTVLTIPAIAVAIAGYLGFLFPVLAPFNGFVIIALIWLVVALNHLGALRVAAWGSATLAIGLIPIIVVGTFGWAYFDPDIFRASWNVSGRSNSSAMFEATFLVFFAFLGLEMASVASGQMRHPERNIPIATIGGIALAAIIYIASTTAITGLFPAAQLAQSSAPFADAAGLVLGPIAGVLVAIAAAAKASGTLGTMQLCSIESLIVSGRLMGWPKLRRHWLNLGNGVLATLIAILTFSDTLAQQFSIIINAIVVLCIVIYALAGFALARACTGYRRIIGMVVAVIGLALFAAQPLPTIVLAILTLGTTLGLSALALSPRFNIHASQRR